MSEPTRLPWRAKKRKWCGETSEHDWYISGDVCEEQEYDEDGELIEVSVSSVGVAVVKGNATAGDIPRLNAELIVRAVNSHADLLEACEFTLKTLAAHHAARGKEPGMPGYENPLKLMADRQIAEDRLKAAVAKAKGG